MGKRIPYFWSQHITLSANSNGTMRFQGGEGETIYIAKMMQASTVDNYQDNSFSVKITDSNGQIYNSTSTGQTAADAGYDGFIDSRLIGDANHPTLFNEQLKLPGNVSLNIALTETSGSQNVISMGFFGWKELGNVV